MNAITTRSLLCCLALALALAPEAGADEDRAKAFRARPLAEKLGTPLRTLETLCFAVDAYDHLPEMIADAVACLDLGDKGDYPEGTPALMAIQLNEIIDELSYPFESVGRGADGKPVVFFNDKEVRVELIRCKDGLWRFSAETIARIPAMRLALVERAKQRNAARAQLREGMEDPMVTMVSFLDYAIAGDFSTAASRLDLSGVPPARRQTDGPLLAWKLACVMQRRGYLFRQSVPFESDGPPYTWSAGRVGRIMVERVRQPGGKDTWLFGRATVDVIDKLWERDKGRPVDPRYLVLKKVVPPPGRAEVAPSAGAAPASVPAEHTSPRAMVRAFFRVIDEAEYADVKLVEAAGFLDLSYLPAADAKQSGPKLAMMLEVVFRKMRLDLSGVSDKWSAPPQVLTGPGGLRVEVIRCGDGCWRFSGDTAARLPALYHSISPHDRAIDDRSKGLGTPREAIVTFFQAINNGDDEGAARCLDLSDMPASARRDVGSVLAFKLKAVLDRTGRIYLQEVPNDPDGPRHILYRGPLGRVAMVRREDDPTKSWRFTTTTVAQIEAMYDRILDLPIDPAVAEQSHIRVGPDFWQEPGVWFRARMPAELRQPLLGLALYQWVGLTLVLAASRLAAFVVGLVARPLVRRYLRGGGEGTLGLARSASEGSRQPSPPSRGEKEERDPTRGHLGSLQMLAFLISLYVMLEWLDLPAAIASPVYSIEKAVLGLALMWAGFQAADVAYMHYKRRSAGERQRSLANLVAHFTMRLAKLGVFLAGVTYLVYEFGQVDALKQFLAGLGLLGLAVSLAAQDSLKNLFATMLLISDRTFRVGDRLIVGDKEGIVEQVGFRSTKLRTHDDSLITLPNSLLANGAIDNLGLRKCSPVRLPFSVSPDTPMERVTKLLDDLKAYLATRGDVDTGRSEARLTGINELGLALELVAFVETEDRAVENRCRCELTFAVVRLARENQIEVRGAKK